MKEQQLHTLYEQCTEEMKLTLHNMPKLVFGDGNSAARVVLVGEAPGGKEEELGKPFVGQAGKNLDQFLEKVGINRDELYVTNVVKYRPFKINPKTGNKVNRPPSQSEIEIFTPYLLEEIHIIQPEYIVTLGNTALRAVLNDNQVQIGEQHGQITYVKVRGQKYSVYPMYHPASVIYRRELASTYEEDLLHFRSILFGEEEETKEGSSAGKKKKILSIFGGSNDPSDPSKKAAEISTSTLKELEVDIVHIDLNEQQLNPDELRSELKQADGVLLSTTIQWLGMGHKLQGFLDACWELQDPSLFQDKYSFITVFTKTQGEGFIAEQIAAAWLYLGGKEGCRLTGYMSPGTGFEDYQSHAIEKKAELFYRILQQRLYDFPHSNTPVQEASPHDSRNYVSRDTEMPSEDQPWNNYNGEDNLDDAYIPDTDDLQPSPQRALEQKTRPIIETPAQREELPKDDFYSIDLKSIAPGEGEDILELTKFFQQKAQGKSAFEQIQEKLEDSFSNKGAQDIEATIQLFITGQETLQMYIEVEQGTFTCRKGIDDSPTVTITADLQEMNHILEGYTTLQKNFLLGKVKAKGSLSHIGIFDKVFSHT